MVAIKEFFPQHAVREGTTGWVSVPRPQHEAFRRGMQRFMREGRILAELKHPHVVGVSDFFEERQTSYLVMELVVGRTLREVMDTVPEKRLAPEYVQKLTTQLVEALEAVHKVGVYHLDIKPDNVLVTASDHVVLLDFGAARQGFSSQSTQSFTTEYAALEVLAGGDVGPESDIFELGMMMHEMLTGKPPPTALERLLRDPWTPTGFQVPWQHLMSSALQLKKEERPSNIRQWWEQALSSKTNAPTGAGRRIGLYIWIVISLFFWIISIHTGLNVWERVDTDGELGAMIVIGAMTGAIYGALIGMAPKPSAKRFGLGLLWGAVLGGSSWGMLESDLNDATPIVGGIGGFCVGWWILAKRFAVARLGKTSR
jgi:serine/threonine protein kinase